MSKTLIIGNEEFEFPVVGTNPQWGEEVTDWAEAVTDALTNVIQPNDILVQSATIANNRTTPASIPGFSFDTSEVVAINAEYIVKRTTDSPATNLVESGYITGNFDGNSWSISQRSNGFSGVEFDITTGGQITYTSSDISGTNYVGQISFKARVFNQA